MVKMYYDPLFTDQLRFPTNSIRVSFRENPTPPQGESNPVAVIHLSDGNTIPVLQGRPGGGRLEAIEVPLTETDVKTFPSLRDLFVQTFDRIGVIVPSEEQLAQKHEAGTHTSPIEIAIRHRANIVAARTRRGEANTLLVGMNSKMSFPEDFTVMEVGGLHDNEAVLLYRGEEHGVIDGPFLAELSLDGSVRAFVLENTSTTLANASDYGFIIEAIDHAVEGYGHIVMDVREL